MGKARIPICCGDHRSSNYCPECGRCLVLFSLEEMIARTKEEKEREYNGDGDLVGHTNWLLQQLIFLRQFEMEDENWSKCHPPTTTDCKVPA